MQHWLPMLLRAHGPRQRPQPQPGPGPSLGFVLGVALLWLSAGSVQAQSRGSLQVATQVLPAQPSQLALAQGLSALGPGSASQSSLATIELRRVGGFARNPTDAKRPRTVLTISFLRN